MLTILAYFLRLAGRASPDERAAGPQARAVETICRRSARSKTLWPTASGAPPPRDWPGEARPRSRSGRRGVEPVFGASTACALARRWRHATLLCWRRADVVPRPVSGRESVTCCCWSWFLVAGRAAAASAAFVGSPARVSSRAGYSAHRLGSRTGREYRLTSPLHSPQEKVAFGSVPPSCECACHGV